MGYVIVTSRNLLWTLTGLTAFLLMLNALNSPTWLVAEPKTVTYSNDTIEYVPSVGVNSKCGKPQKFYASGCTALHIHGLASDAKTFPTVWKASFVFIGLGLAIMATTVVLSVASFCFQSLFRKSIFTMSGAAQALAGIFYIMGVMLYPMAWGSWRVQSLCGRDATPFYLGDCSIGVGLWCAVLGTSFTFGAACLSVLAENSTSSDKVQDKIYEGHTLICLP